MSCFQWSFRCALHCTENSRGGGTELPNGWICMTSTSRCTYSSHSFLQQLRKLLDFAIWHTKQFAVWIGFITMMKLTKKTERSASQSQNPTILSTDTAHLLLPHYQTEQVTIEGDLHGHITHSASHILCWRGNVLVLRIWFPGLMHTWNAEHK